VVYIKGHIDPGPTIEVFASAIADKHQVSVGFPELTNLAVLLPEIAQ
jgi:hypothetical protein